jgi:hypothetical protein
MFEFSTIAFIGALMMAGAFMVTLYKMNQASDEM